MPTTSGCVRVAVAGAHLRGQPFHQSLLGMGARFVRACQTAACYRFVALMHLAPPRPGLIRDDARAGSALVEIYELPFEGFGKLVASVAPPLAIGTVEMEDGEKIKGFLCESWAVDAAQDITDFGDWSLVAFFSKPPANRRRLAHDRFRVHLAWPDSGGRGSGGRGSCRAVATLRIPARILAAVLPMHVPYCCYHPASSAAARRRNCMPKDDNTPLVVGFIYIGARDDYGYNQAHAQGAAAVKKIPGVVVKEEETVPDTMDVQKSMKGMIELNQASVIFPTSFGYYDPHVLRAWPLSLSAGEVHPLRRPLRREASIRRTSAPTSVSSTNASICPVLSRPTPPRPRSSASSPARRSPRCVAILMAVPLMGVPAASTRTSPAP